MTCEGRSTYAGLDNRRGLRFCDAVWKIGSGVRYDALIATIIATLAVAVSAYTAWLQRQQVRAQVWPVLEYGSWNEPELKLWLANKGVGPAFIRHAIVTVDDNPVADWKAMMQKLLGPGRYSFTSDSIRNRVLSAGENLALLTPHFDSSRQELVARFDKEPFRVGAELAATFDKERSRVGVEICYCSTLGECWTLFAPAHQPSRIGESDKCPAPSASTFER